jgi:hypothetical protein
MKSIHSKYSTWVVMFISLIAGWKLVRVSSGTQAFWGVKSKIASPPNITASLPLDLAQVPAEFTKGMPSTLGEILSEIRPVQRLLGLMSLAGTASKSELQTMLREARNDTTARHYLSVRWAQDDPQGLYDWLIRERARVGGSWTMGDYLNDIRSLLFTQWASQGYHEGLYVQNRQKRPCPSTVILRAVSCKYSTMGNGRADVEWLV